MKIKLTKVATGIAFGDVSNSAIRNILTEISKSISGKFTEQDMLETLDYFDWKCPYTGRDLRKSLEDHDDTYVTDHICPQNQEWCGLNVKGNLVIVDKRANGKKSTRNVEDFLLNDTTVLGSLDCKIRQERLEKIKTFQKLCGYDPEAICRVVKPILMARYAELRKEQEDCIEKSLAESEKEGIHPIGKAPSKNPGRKVRTLKAIPEIIFASADEQQFKDELIKSKKAYFILTYSTGEQKTISWEASNFTSSSNLRANIQSRSFWRKKDEKGLVKVEVFIGEK